MSRCETTQDSPAELADWTPIQTPDGLWCVWSERTQLPIKLGTKQAILLPDVSKALGSIDRAHDAFRAAHADPDRWARLLASLPPATARFLASKVGAGGWTGEVAELRQMPASSASNPYAVGDQAAYGRHYPNPPRYDHRIKALHADGLITAEIARQIGCKELTVRKAYGRLDLVANRISGRKTKTSKETS